MSEGMIFLVVGVIVSASLIVAIGAVRTGLPLLVGFLVLGMVLGSDGPGGINFDDAALTRKVGTLGLALILYDGGLQTSWRRLRQVAVPAALLSTVGVVVTALGAGVAARLLFGLSWLESILLGAIVASTDAAAVFAAMRTSRVELRLARTLEAESGGNDPMAIALTLGLIAWMGHPGTYNLGDLTLLVLRQLCVGLASGAMVGWLAALIIARFPRSIAAFAPVASIAVLALAYGTADVLGGSGFLAVYLAGLAVGSTPSSYHRQLVAFHEGLAFLAQVGLFILLGLLVFPDQLPGVVGRGLALTLLLVIVIRPIAVWVSTAMNGFSTRERILLGWAGLRGAVPIVLATFAISAHVRHANTIFNAVFFVVVTSTILQGTTLEHVAERLRLLVAAPPLREAPLEVGSESTLELWEFVVSAGDVIAGAPVRELGLPRNAIVAVVSRGDQSIPPRGSTVIECDDRLLILGPRDGRDTIEDVFTRWRRRI